ncbi:MAG TPA: hypothetical protein VGB94_14190 [Acidobacteriaceae bacterium]
MALILQQNGYSGWSGAVDSTVVLQARVKGNTELVAVLYNGQTITPTVVTADAVWSVQFKIAAGTHRIFFTFASASPNEINIVEVDAAGGAAEQEIAGAAQAVSPTFSPMIKGV